MSFGHNHLFSKKIGLAIEDRAMELLSFLASLEAWIQNGTDFQQNGCIGKVFELVEPCFLPLYEMQTQH